LQILWEGIYLEQVGFSVNTQRVSRPFSLKHDCAFLFIRFLRGVSLRL